MQFIQFLGPFIQKLIFKHMFHLTFVEHFGGNAILRKRIKFIYCLTVGG
ncbi:hypothetical protein PHEL85_2415 [Polaribacter sp. Hel1_85]|nr:hypothetical protein PHEL85_2415 [Polaribacter sp. Hel1_85]